MNKNEFLALLRAHLSALPPEEQNELLEDYEAHFAFGLQSGRSEEEIVLELGDPAELAKEALDNRYVPQDHVYWFGADSADRRPVPEKGMYGDQPAYEPAAAAGIYAGGTAGTSAVRRRGAFATTMVYIGLFFLNIVFAPLLLAFWGVAVSLAASALCGILSPLALGLEYVVHGDVYLAKVFAAVATVGLSILLAVASRIIFKGLIRLTAAYRQWNVRERG